MYTTRKTNFYKITEAVKITVMIKVHDVTDQWKVGKLKSSPEELWIVANMVVGAGKVLGKRRKPFLKFSNCHTTLQQWSSECVLLANATYIHNTHAYI